MMKKIITFFSLFGSLSTLVCCALPVTLVSLGMGATFASLTSIFPQVIWIAENKNPIFLVTAILLGISFVLIQHAEKLPCPIDPLLRDACVRNRKFSKIGFYISLVFYLIGLVFSYLLPWILQ